MIISIIVAIDRNGLMGLNNELPWHLPNDLKYFKEKTLNKPIIMGRKTYESIGKALPKRKNIVLSNNPLAHYNDAIGITHIDDAIKIATLEEDEECFIIGGNSIFELALKNDLVDRIYLTIIGTEINITNSDDSIYFNEDFEGNWDLKSINKLGIDEKNKFKSHYLVYEKN